MSASDSGRPRQWRFDWRLMVFAGVFLPLLIGLGLWQLDRAAEKKIRLAQWQQQATELSWPQHIAEGLQPGQPVTLTGEYGNNTWLLDNRTRDGAVGYEVLTLFYPESGSPLVINRGWILAPRRRDELPDINTPEGGVAVSGRLSEYPVPPVLMQTPNDQAGWPKRVQALTRAEVTAQVPAVAPLILRLKGPDQPGAYRADWTPDTMGPQTHYGYAVQWFSLAAALVILTLVASYRRTGNNNDNG
jgi:surfeit locus 1 family protein